VIKPAHFRPEIAPAFAARWALDRRFTAGMDEATRSRKIAAWKHAVAAH
jgi:hypothetical protein